jgi:2-dehydro-3-deoxygalactonokinase
VDETALIGIDWGSSSVRVMRIARDGRVLAVRRADDGVFTGSGDDEERLRRLLGGWNDAPILLCGMIGSDRGWRHAPYVPAPANLGSVARALVRLPQLAYAYIVPGVSARERENAEIMRGEETIALGAIIHASLKEATLCLPGTHSKWLRVRGGQIDSFRTHMTGELRALLLAQGTLASAIAQVASRQAFQAGLETRTAPLASALFQARARRLLETLAGEHSASFIAGVLIGQEVASQDLASGAPLFLLARGAIAEDYGLALTRVGIAFTLVDPEPLTALGLLGIATQAGLLPSS